MKAPTTYAPPATSPLRASPTSPQFASSGPHETQYELVGGHFRLARRIVARVGGVAQEVAFAVEHESRLPDFGTNDGFVDAVQRLAIGDAGAAARGMVDDDEVATGFQRREEPLVHLRAVDGKVADVVVIQHDGDQ